LDHKATLFDQEGIATEAPKEWILDRIGNKFTPGVRFVILFYGGTTLFLRYGSTTQYKKASNKAISYEEYRAFVQAYTDNGTNSGDEVTEALTAYTALNNQRMKRRDKIVKILLENQDFLSASDREIYFLIRSESHCGDAAQTMLVMKN
jgi:hypothetical protein